MHNKIDRLVDLLRKYLPNLEQDAGSGTALNFPEYDLTPYDYLEFSEKEIDSTETRNKINTVSNLKRALECELDTLLEILGLNDKKYKKSYSLNVPVKLDFVGRIGLVSPRSFKKLNRGRNKIEHEYHVPEDNEIDSFYDLVFTLVSAVDGFILFFGSSKDLYFYVDSEDEKIRFEIEYIEDDPSLKFKFIIEGKDEELTFPAKDYDEFVLAFGIYLLIIKFTCLVSSSYVLKQMETLYSAYKKS